MSPSEIATSRSVSSVQFRDGFYQSLDARFRAKLGSRWLPKLGFAISGGVDSMALLWLWQRFMTENPSITRRGYRAFIVDHRARPESSGEASRVAAAVSQLMGQDPEIMTLQWPSDPNATSSNFETTARRLRYRALGQACQAHGIASIVLGHHADDNVETVWARLAGKHFAPTGMSLNAHVPECEGIYGLYESGRPYNFPTKDRGVSGIETGGLRVLRPLLSFSKDSLIATCKENSVPWVEDPTNQDQSLTWRNSIRHIFQVAKVPRALSKPSLGAGVVRTKEKIASLEVHVKRLLMACRVHALDIRGGILMVSVPSLESVFGTSITDGANSWLDNGDKYYVCSCVVRQLIDYVSPMETVPLDRVATALYMLFPDVFPQLAEVYDKRTSLTIGGVLIELRRPPTTEKPALAVLFREPIARAERRPAVFFPPPKEPTHKTQLNTREASAIWSKCEIVEPSGSPHAPALWDGRWWIRITRHKSPHGLLLVPLEQHSLKDFYASFKTPFGHRALTWAGKVFNGSTTSVSRFTLPAIVAPPGAPSLDAGAVIALPSLGLVRPEYAREIAWEMRYKKVEEDGLKWRDRVQSYAAGMDEYRADHG